MDKIEISNIIFNFKDSELSPELVNSQIEVLNWENMATVSYLVGKFYIKVEIDQINIKIEKEAKAYFKELKNGKLQLKISKQESKNLANLIYTAHNVLRNEL